MARLVLTNRNRFALKWSEKEILVHKSTTADRKYKINGFTVTHCPHLSNMYTAESFDVDACFQDKCQTFSLSY